MFKNEAEKSLFYQHRHILLLWLPLSHFLLSMHITSAPAYRTHTDTHTHILMNVPSEADVQCCYWSSQQKMCALKASLSRNSTDAVSTALLLFKPHQLRIMKLRIRRLSSKPPIMGSVVGRFQVPPVIC